VRSVLPTFRPWLALLLFFSVAATGWAATSDSDIKAVFLFHFTQFVEWPQDAFPSANSPFVIGILGVDPLEAVLAGIVRGETVGQHPIVVRDLRGEDEASRCQIVYVTEHGERYLDTRRLQNAPILTVGESDSFFRSGGVIQLYIDHRRVRLRINLAEARAHSLVISAKLLRVADVSGGPSALELPSGLAEDGPLDLLLLRAGHPVLGMGGVQEILADDR
jgi:YfiR/HmsC-like